MPANAKKKENVLDEAVKLMEQATEEITAESKVTTLKAVPKKTSVKETNVKNTKKTARKTLTRSERIARQANPKTTLAGKQKTFTLNFDYTSDILHEYLELNQTTMLRAYERLAGLLRLCASDKSTYTHVNQWIATNLSISQEQLNILQKQRQILTEEVGDELDELDVHIPDNYQVEFEVSHPIARKMIALLRLIDQELNATEELFMHGLVDDAAYMQLRNQVSAIVRGSVDRIYKATSPGVRDGGRFVPAQLMGWIKNGNKMLFADVSKNLEYLTQTR